MLCRHRDAGLGKQKSPQDVPSRTERLPTLILASSRSVAAAGEMAASVESWVSDQRGPVFKRDKEPPEKRKSVSSSAIHGLHASSCGPGTLQMATGMVATAPARTFATLFLTPPPPCFLGSSHTGLYSVP